MTNYCTECPNKVSHVHAKLIKAWADGAVIEFKSYDMGWCVTPSPHWRELTKYRIKPEPKPDIINYVHLYYDDEENKTTLMSSFTQRISNSNVKVIFDGETGKLIAIATI